MKNRKIIIIMSLCIVVLLILTLGIAHKITSKKIKVFHYTDTIQRVEITDGTSGDRVIVENAEQLEEIQSVIEKIGFISNPQAEDETGYQWSIFVKGEKHNLEIMSENQVMFERERIAFLKQEDYKKLVDYIENLLQVN